MAWLHGRSTHSLTGGGQPLHLAVKEGPGLQMEGAGLRRPPGAPLSSAAPDDVARAVCAPLGLCGTQADAALQASAAREEALTADVQRLSVLLQNARDEAEGAASEAAAERSRLAAEMAATLEAAEQVKAAVLAECEVAMAQARRSASVGVSEAQALLSRAQEQLDASAAQLLAAQAHGSALEARVEQLQAAQAASAPRVLAKLVLRARSVRILHLADAPSHCLLIGQLVAWTIYY